MAGKNGIFITDSEMYSLNYDTKNGILKPLNIYRKVPTNVYSLDNLQNNNFYNNILPRNCRYIMNGMVNNYDTKSMMIIEDPPSIRTIKVSHIILESEARKLISTGKKSYVSDKSLSKSNVTISLPYIIYMIFFDKRMTYPMLNIYYRLSPIRSMNDFLIQANLPNVTLRGEVCTGDFKYKDKECIKNNFNEIAEQLISHFWLSQFNNEIMESYDSQKNSTSTFLEWQYFTKIDPTFIFKEKWIYNRNNIASIIGIDKSKDTNKNIDVINLFNNNMNNIYNGKENEYEEDDDYNVYYEYFIDDNIVLESRSYITIDKVKYLVLSFQDDKVKLLDIDKNETFLITMTKRLCDDIKKQIEGSKINQVTVSKKNLVVGDYYRIMKNDDSIFYKSFSISLLEDITKSINDTYMLKFNSGSYLASETFVKDNIIKINNKRNELLNKNILLFTYNNCFMMYEEFIISEIDADHTGFVLDVISCVNNKKHYLHYTPNNIINFSFDVNMFNDCNTVNSFKIGDMIYTSDNKNTFFVYKDNLFCKSLDMFIRFRRVI